VHCFWVIRWYHLESTDARDCEREPGRTGNKNIEFREEFFNMFNHVNFANPVSDVDAINAG
jgi:hypothetical protein